MVVWLFQEGAAKEKQPLQKELCCFGSEVGEKQEVLLKERKTNWRPGHLVHFAKLGVL